METLPTRAQVVVVGGGIVGCSTAYHLTQMGCRDVVLLERARLTSGSTFHAAGLVGQLRSSASITLLLGESVDLYQRLEAETGLSTGWKQNGGLRLATTPDRMGELRHQATTASSFGLEFEILSPVEAKILWPLMNVDDLVGAAFLPTDGSANPTDLTQALARGARAGGANLIEDCTVTGVEIENGRVAGVQTTQGQIECEVVVNCAGQWAREFGRLAGVNVPLVSIQHQYLVSDLIEGVSGDLPTLRDPDRLTYFKEETGGLVVGGYEPNPVPWGADGIPEDFVFSLLEPDHEHFEQLMGPAVQRVPALGSAGVRTMVNGPESFTPDGNFILGEAPELARYFVAAGFNAFGIAAAGGAGMALAAWILDGGPPFDLWPVDIRRFGPPHADDGWVRARTSELYAKHYTVSWPDEEHSSARPFRRSPLYEDLSAANAVFGEKFGWERPNWFAPAGVEPVDRYSFERPSWFNQVGVEHHATRESVALFDQSSFAKLEVSGPDAPQLLSWLCANDVDKAIGSITYTQMLSERAGIEADLTVARLDEELFYLVTGTAFATHDRHWIESHVPKRADVHIREVTSEIAVLAVMGPHSRDVLSTIVEGDLDNEAFPFGTMQVMSVAGVTTRLLRITYVGELGFELHIPTDDARGVYRAVTEAGQSFGIVNAGYRAIESLRLEKGYRAWAADITPSDTPLEAGLGWAVKLNSEIEFSGRARAEQQREEGIQRRLATFATADPDVTLLGRETILRNGKKVGWLTSGGWGYTVDAAIGLGYVNGPTAHSVDEMRRGTYELEVATVRVPAEIHFRSLYDPAMSRVRT